MRLHVNVVTIIAGVLISGTGPGFFGPVAGLIVIASEVYRCRRIEALTSDIPADTILKFYRGDRARRYYGAKSTAHEIRNFVAKAETN